MVDRPDSPYPYTLDGKIAVPSDADWLDPLVALAFVAAVTSRIRIATGILLLPQHNPVVVAKQAASLDVLSEGRFVLGVGVGWSSEEFAALGVPFGGEPDEWRSSSRPCGRCGVTTSRRPREFVRFHEVRSYPKPVRARRLPVLVGGNSDRALDRVVAYGDGWYGFNLSRWMSWRSASRCCAPACVAAGAWRFGGGYGGRAGGREPEDLAQVEGLGVDELVVVAAPPADPAEVAAWVDELGGRWNAHRSAPPYSIAGQCANPDATLLHL